jgi:hypothetical protein
MAKQITSIFKRYEKKYLINGEQYDALTRMTADLFSPDEFGRSVIMNIYFDTPNSMLIRRSLEKPVYKEKLRLRTYGVPNDDSNAFVEIKKKFKKVVYKRRVKMKYTEAYDYLINGAPAPKTTQITNEIDWFMKYYGDVRPAMVISYERTAMFSKENKDLRITYDNNILWRKEDLDLRRGAYGEPLLPEGHYLMEIKIPGAMPVWLAEMLDELKIYPTSFSKYGMAYITDQKLKKEYPEAFPEELPASDAQIKINAIGE